MCVLEKKEGAGSLIVCYRYYHVQPPASPQTIIIIIIIIIIIVIITIVSDIWWKITHAICLQMSVATSGNLGRDNTYQDFYGGTLTLSFSWFPKCVLVKG